MRSFPAASPAASPAKSPAASTAAARNTIMALPTTPNRRAPPQRRAPTLAASPWPRAVAVAAVVVVVIAMAGVNGVDGGPILAESQVQFLRDCQDAWGNPSATWPADDSNSNWDCGALEFVSCDENGMIVKL
ncbi:unnamed protein product, partial [Closterium sp. Naga37s-1]